MGIIPRVSENNACCQKGIWTKQALQPSNKGLFDVPHSGKHSSVWFYLCSVKPLYLLLKSEYSSTTREKRFLSNSTTDRNFTPILSGVKHPASFLQWPKCSSPRIRLSVQVTSSDQILCIHPANKAKNRCLLFNHESRWSSHWSQWDTSQQRRMPPSFWGQDAYASRYISLSRLLPDPEGDLQKTG